MTAPVVDVGGTALVTLASLAGPCLLLAGGLITISQIAVWPLRADGLTAALTSPIYAISMTAYLIGMWVFIIGVFALHQRQARQTKTFGLMPLSPPLSARQHGGQPLVRHLRGAVAGTPDSRRAGGHQDGTLVAGALFGYVSMAAGWMVLGVASLRARLIPAPLALSLIPAGLLAFFPLPPYSIGFGIVVLAVGIWLARHHDRPPAD